MAARPGNYTHMPVMAILPNARVGPTLLYHVTDSGERKVTNPSGARREVEMSETGSESDIERRVTETAANDTLGGLFSVFVIDFYLLCNAEQQRGEIGRAHV